MGVEGSSLNSDTKLGRITCPLLSEVLKVGDPNVRLLIADLALSMNQSSSGSALWSCSIMWYEI